MPAHTKVSVAWQTVFTFLPIVNFWAFYRMRKLCKYVLYVIVPSIALSITINFHFAVFGATGQFDSFRNTPARTKTIRQSLPSSTRKVDDSMP